MIADLQGGALSKTFPASESPGSGRFEKLPSLAIRFAHGRARVVSRADLPKVEEWRRAFAGNCKDHRFYEIAEETLASGWEHSYLVLEDSDGKVRAIQPVFFVRQNLVEGIPALRGVVEAIRRRFPRFLTMRVLMAGNAAGSSHLGCASEDEEWAAEALGQVLRIYARKSNASLVVFKDFPAKYRPALQKCVAAGYTRAPSMPATELRLGYAGFEQYLNTLGRSTRKDLRRKFRKIAGAAPITLEVTTDLTPHLDEVYPLYLQVYERSPLKFERLTKEFLSALGQRMPDRARFFIWRQNGRIVAFSVAMVHDGRLYDDYLGLDYRIALDLHLYFYTLRDIISWALAQGIERYRSSPLNYKPKLHLGCDLYPLDLYVLHTTPRVNAVFRRALKFLEPTRHDPVLRQFRNARELHGNAK